MTTRQPDTITDAYCLRLAEAKERHDFDDADLAEREGRSIITIQRCLQRAKQVRLRKALRGVNTEIRDDS